VTRPDCPPIAPSEPETTRRKIRHGLSIAIASLLLNLAGNASVGLWDRDEPRYAVAVREMRERGDWVSPSFNGEPRYHKPILIYWVMGLGTTVFGDNPFGARIGSAIAGTATALICWWLGRRLLGPIPALLGSLALVTSPLMVAESKLATTDATLTLFLILAQGCLWSLNQSDSWRVALGFWASMALAVLTKGPVGLVLIASAGLASWWFGGPTVCWSRLRWRVGLVLFAAIALPWFAAIGIRSNGDFFRFAIGSQLVQRMTTRLEEHGGFPGYYPVCTLLAFYPWSALIPAALAAAWSRRKESPTFGFLLGWVVGPLIPLELFRTKLIHYYLPALPALALLIGWFVTALSFDVISIRRWPLGRVGTGLIGGIGIALTAGLFAGSTMLHANLALPCLSLGIVVAVGTLVALILFTKCFPIEATRVLIGCWALFMVLFVGWFLPLAESYRFSRIIGEKLAYHADAERAKPVLVTFQEPGIIYAMNRRLNVPTMRTWDAIWDQLQRTRTVVTAVTAEQGDSLELDGRFQLDVLEVVNGFNLNKGASQSLRLARLRLRGAALSRRPVEQTSVK